MYLMHRAGRSPRTALEQLLDDPLFNFGAIAVTLASILSLAWPILAKLSLEWQNSMRVIDRALLGLIALHMVLQLVAPRGRRYIRGLPFLADMLVCLPLFAWLAGLALETAGLVNNTQIDALAGIPGMRLLSGVRVLRLLNTIPYFYLQRQMGLAGDRVLRSELKQRIMNGVSATLVFLVLIIGVLFAQATRAATRTQQTLRIQQIQLQAANYGALQARLLFQNSVLSVRSAAGGAINVVHNDNWPPDRIGEELLYGRDYIQLDGQANGLRPGESVQIFLADLRRREDAQELFVVAMGFIAAAAVLLLLNRYLDRLILAPAERAVRVSQLRLKGEEIERSGISQEPFTELTLLINSYDLLYQKMRAPARKLLTHSTAIDNLPESPAE
ncbi:MAG: ion transporter [Leptospirales bacterium]|nr:ion transporter [Leptospirales bacterium]